MSDQEETPEAQIHRSLNRSMGAWMWNDGDWATVEAIVRKKIADQAFDSAVTFRKGAGMESLRLMSVLVECQRLWTPNPYPSAHGSRN